MSNENRLLSKSLKRKLLEPFKKTDLEWRVLSHGQGSNGPWARVAAYIDARAIQERLDEVFGIDRWQNEFLPLPNGDNKGVMCGISVRFGTEWVTKYDAAELTDVQATKGGMSASMKRAAVQWGIGRYLYEIESGWAKTSMQPPAKEDESNWIKAQLSDNRTNYWWRIPDLAAEHLPQKKVDLIQIRTIEALLAELDGAKKKEDDSKTVDDYMRFFDIDILEDLYSEEATKMITSLKKKAESLKVQTRAKNKKDSAA